MKKSDRTQKKSGDGRLGALEKRLGLMEIELEVYREIGGLAVKGASRATLLSSLMDFALKALEAASGTLYLLDDKAGELVSEVVKGPLAARFKGLRMNAADGIAGLVARTGKPYLSQDLASDRRWAGPKDSGSRRCMLAVPLIRKKTVIGVIQVLDKPGTSPFTTADARTLASLANHFSIIMERADLFRALDDRIRQSSTLNEVGALLVSSLDPSVVRRRAMEAITGLMHAETGSLLLVDRDKGELFFEVALGAKGMKIKEVRLKIGEGIAGWVAKHGKPLVIDDVTKDRRFQGSLDKRSKFRTRNMVCVPVAIKGRIIGVLQAINRLGGGPFSRDDLRLFQLFSNQVAIALDNARLYQEIKETFHATSGALAEAIEKRDPYTGGHTRRVLAYSLATARQLDLPPDAIEVLKLSAVLHDIGKIGIEDSILRKESPLEPDEARSMKTHPELGADIMKHVPQLRDVVPGMLYHHERVDGLGYPMGLRQDDIPLVARIIAVADTYDAMTTDRPYRKGLPQSVALKELKRCSGGQFDAVVVRAFIKAFRNGDMVACAQTAFPQAGGAGRQTPNERTHDLV